MHQSMALNSASESGWIWLNPKRPLLWFFKCQPVTARVKQEKGSVLSTHNGRMGQQLSVVAQSVALIVKAGCIQSQLIRISLFLEGQFSDIQK